MPYKDPERMRQYLRDWREKRRAKWFAEHGPCIDCGSWDDLEPDHNDPAQKVNSRNIWGWPRERREAELAKCVVRCHPCHVAKTRAAGEYSGGRKLTETQVRAVRASPDEPARILAEQYGVKPDAIHRIRRGDTWKHLL